MDRNIVVFGFLEGFILTKKDSSGHVFSLHLQDSDIIEEDSSSITISGVLAYERNPERFYGSICEMFFESSEESKTKISHEQFEVAVGVMHGNIFIGRI